MLENRAVGTLLGMIPPTLLLSYLGESLTTSMTRTIIVLFLILILFVGLPFLMRRLKVTLPEFHSFKGFGINSILYFLGSY